MEILAPRYELISSRSYRSAHRTRDGSPGSAQLLPPNLSGRLEVAPPEVARAAASFQICAHEPAWLCRFVRAGRAPLIDWPGASLNFRFELDKMANHWGATPEDSREQRAHTAGQDATGPGLIMRARRAFIF